MLEKGAGVANCHYDRYFCEIIDLDSLQQVVNNTVKKEAFANDREEQQIMEQDAAGTEDKDKNPTDNAMKISSL
jgi:hypothetical protein